MALIPAPIIATSMDEIRPILRSKAFWVFLCALSAVLALAGPFGTAASLSIPLRLIYWPVIVLTTGTVGFIVGFVGCDVIHAYGVPKWLASLFSGVVCSLPVAAIVFTVNAVFLSPGDLSIADGPLALSILAISTVISFATYLGFFADRPAGPALPPYTGRPRLLDRLPEDQHGPLISLEATDHYTRITTDHGSAMVLLRFSDAIAEAAPTPGLRLHRSHWVAIDRIAAARRDGPRAVVTTTDGREIPVSRANVPALEEAGLLPPR